MAPYRDQTIESFIHSIITPSSAEHDATEDRPIFVVNLDNVIEKYVKWKELVPRVHPFYAVKCNDAPGILKVLARIGCGFDCASSYELTAVAALDVKPDRIIFANPVKTNMMLKHASQLSVDMMTFDSESELLKIRREYPQAKLVIRLKVDDSGSEYQLGKKFGVKLDEAIRLLNIASSIHANVIGVAFHVGSDCHKADSYESALQLAKVVFDIAQTFDFDMQLLDIGGGYPGLVDFNDPSDCFYLMVEKINAALDHYFPECQYPNLRIISEPGRYFAATSSTLITKIIGKRLCRPDAEVEEHDGDHNESTMMYFLNDGLFGDMLGKIWEPQYLKFMPGISTDEMIKRTSYKSTLWGPTCDSTDVLASEIILPEMQIGEHFISPNYGAYTACLKTLFNGMESAIFKYYVSDKYKNLLTANANGDKLISRLN